MNLFAVVISCLYGLGLSMFGWQVFHFVTARLDPAVPMTEYERRVLLTYSIVMAVWWPFTMPLCAFSLVCYRAFTEHTPPPVTVPAAPPVDDAELFAPDIEAAER